MPDTQHRRCLNVETKSRRPKLELEPDNCKGHICFAIKMIVMSHFQHYQLTSFWVHFFCLIPATVCQSDEIAIVGEKRLYILGNHLLLVMIKMVVWAAAWKLVVVKVEGVVVGGVLQQQKACTLKFEFRSGLRSPPTELKFLHPFRPPLHGSPRLLISFHQLQM